MLFHLIDHIKVFKLESYNYSSVNERMKLTNVCFIILEINVAVRFHSIRAGLDSMNLIPETG